jgi:hypothetical protein
MLQRQMDRERYFAPFLFERSANNGTLKMHNTYKSPNANFAVPVFRGDSAVKTQAPRARRGGERPGCFRVINYLPPEIGEAERHKY